MEINPRCPRCSSREKVAKAGYNRPRHGQERGSQRYYCYVCNVKFSIERKPGRPKLGEEKLTPAQRSQRLRRKREAKLRFLKEKGVL